MRSIITRTMWGRSNTHITCWLWQTGTIKAQVLECQSAYCSDAQVIVHVPLLKCSSQSVAHRPIALKCWGRVHGAPPHVFVHSDGNRTCTGGHSWFVFSQGWNFLSEDGQLLHSPIFIYDTYFRHSLPLTDTAVWLKLKFYPSLLTPKSMEALAAFSNPHNGSGVSQREKKNSIQDYCDQM